jgi:hypothetical protein
MNSKRNQVGRCNAPLAGVLTIVFIILKLAKVIDWSWWWVVSSIWIIVSLIVFMTGLSAILIVLNRKLNGI